MRLINIKQAPIIKNMNAMPRGLNARYLECIEAHNGDLVASQWRRKEPKQYAVLIDFVGDICAS